jgi:hypothetical protein
VSVRPVQLCAVAPLPRVNVTLRPAMAALPSSSVRRADAWRVPPLRITGSPV